MTRQDKKIKKPVALYTVIESDQHEALRARAFLDGVPVAHLVREALDNYLAKEAPTSKEVEGLVKRLRSATKKKRSRKPA